MVENNKKSRQEKIENFLLDPDKVIFESMEEFAEATAEILSFLKNVDFESLEKIQGENGVTPIFGEDFFTEDDMKGIEEFIVSKIPKIGEDLPSTEQVRAFVRSEISKIEIPKAEPAKPSKPGKPGKDGSPDNGKQILNKIRSLSKAGSLKVSDINGLGVILRTLKESAEEIDDIKKNLKEELIISMPAAIAAASNPYLGLFLNVGALPATASPGDYADVDPGIGTDVTRYIWDDSDNAWVEQGAVSLGDMTKAVYDPAAVNEQLLGLTATQTPTNKSIDGDNNTITNIGFSAFDTDVADTMKFTAGAYLDQPSVSVTSDGTTVSCSIEKSGGGDLRIIFLTGVYIWDTTPAATVALTAGTDPVPQINYIYIDEATKTYQANTTGFPIADITRVATVLCQSAVSVQADGPYKIHGWTDHMASTTCGHLSHINAWVRSRPAGWLDGVALTPTVTINGAVEDNVDIATSAGNVLQLHPHVYPAFDTSVASEVYIVNKSGANYTKITDLNAADEDDAGTAIGNNQHINLVIWGSVNESDSKMFINLPSGIHGNNQSQAIADAEKYSNYNIPSDYIGTGFLIARLTFKYTTAAGGTWVLVENLDLRGQFPSTFAGGSAATTTVFVDSVFRILDNLDESKEIDFQAAGITTGTKRTMTMPDVDVDLGDIATNNAKISYTDAAAVALNTAKISYTDAAAVALNTAKTGVTTEIKNVVEDLTPQLGGPLDAGAHSIGFTMQTATGDGTTTVTWDNGNHIDFTFGAFNEVFTFTAPSKPGVYTMSLKQDSIGSRTATWPATVKWPGGTAPTLTTTLTTGYDIIAFRFDGTNYYGTSTLNFS